MKRTNTVNAPRALDIKGQPHQLSYITAEEAEVLKTRGGSGKPGPMGIPSFFIDDDDEEAELSEAITGSYTGSDGSQQTGFTFDDGGDDGVNYTLGKSDPRGGTEIQGNVIRGGKIFGRTQSQLDRQQRLAGMGDYRNSQQYKDYLTATGRSPKNPYGNTGLFSGIFGADKVNYNLDPAQAQNILDIGFDRYMNFDQQPESAQRRGFGKLFGGPEGEMTVEGELRAQVPEMTTAESLFRSVIPGASFLPNPDTTYVPMGTVDFQPNPGYDPERDPRANRDLRSGPFSLLTDALSKGRDFIASKLSPAEELAAQTQTQARGPELSELSQTVSGGRFENESAIKRPLSTTIPTPEQEAQTFGVDIGDSRSPSQNIDESVSKFMASGDLNPQKVSTVGLDQINPLTVDFLDDIDLGQLADIVGKAQSGDLFSKQTPFGTLSIEPEFQGLKPVGGMIRLKGTF